MMKYNQVLELKSEINSYVSILNCNDTFKDDSKIRGITKNILFLKQLGRDSHYKRAMIYDLLMLLDALTKNSKRNFYTLYRSFLENFIRFSLDLHDNDITGVRELFRLFKDTYEKDENTTTFINYIEGEYGKSCNYIHSNINADIELYQYYKDILQSNEMSNKAIIQLTNAVLTLVKKVTTFIVCELPLIVDSSFYRNKVELKFLIGKSNFNMFKSNLYSLTS